MDIIAVGNNKGGIAKTTTCIHLGAFLAEAGYKVLLIDFDPQSNLSKGYKIPKDYPYTVLNLLNGEENFRVNRKADNLYILSGSRELDTVTRDIFILKRRLEQLEKLSKMNNQKPYDFVVIDMPPEVLTKKFYIDSKDNKIHIPKLNEIAVAAAHYVMTPINAEEYSIDGLENILRSIIDFRKEFNPKLEILGVFFTMVSVIKRDFKNYYKSVANDIPEKYFFNSFIRNDQKINDAKKVGKSIFEYAPKSRASIDYKNLCNELLDKIK